MKTLTGNEYEISKAFDSIGENTFGCHYHKTMLDQEPNKWRKSVTIKLPDELHDRLVIALITQKLES